MRSSAIDPTIQFNEEIWVVTALNTGSALGGHSMLVVEGMERNERLHPKLFVGQFDITAIADEKQEGSINVKGYINDLRCFVSDEYKRDYKQYKSKSHPISHDKAKLMIADIIKDHKRTEQAKKGQAEYIPYQLLGKDHILSDPDNGINCSNWAAEKLGIAGVQSNGKKPVKLVTSCTVS